MNDRLHPIGRFGAAPVEYLESFLHVAVVLRGNRIVGDEVLRLVAFQGQESASELFEYQLELRADSPDGGASDMNFAFDELIGRPVTVGIDTPSEWSKAEAAQRFRQAVETGADPGEGLSLFNGIVTAFSMEVEGVYRLSMKPALARLQLTNGYLVHSQASIVEAVANLLDKHRIAYSMAALSHPDNPACARRQDWLQAGETDYEFMLRLLRKEHIYFFFVCTGNSHTVVFANGPAYPQVLKNGAPLRYTSTDIDPLALAQSDVIGQYSYRQNLASSGVSGTLTRQYASWENDYMTPFYRSYFASSKTELGELPFHQYKSWQYGGSSDEVSEYTDKTGEALDTAALQFSGSSFCARFRAGHQFRVSGADSHSSAAPVRPTLDGRAFVLTMVKHEASADGGYKNDFEATDASGLIAAMTLQETQQGSMLARVVAHGNGQEPTDWRFQPRSAFDPELSILTDTLGTPSNLRAKGAYVVFATDEYESDPVWIKLAPGMTTVPDIDSTVMVSRSQDESEVPEIQNVVQSVGGMTVTPSTWTAHTSYGNNYSTSYGDSNSIRTGYNSVVDLDNAVAIVTTPYQSGNYRDTSYSQGAGYSFSVAESTAATFSPDSGELFGPYAGASDLMNASESSGSSYSRQYAQVTSSYSNIGTQYSNSVLGKSESHSLTTGTTYSESTQKGSVTSISNIFADSYSTHLQIGMATSVSNITGVSINMNTQIGAIYSGNYTIGATVSTSNVIGDSTNTSFNEGLVTSSNTIIGVSSNTSTQVGAASNVSTNIGDTSTVSTVVGSTSNVSTVVGNSNAVSTNVGLVSAVNTVLGSSTTMSTTLGASTNETMVLGASSNVSTILGVSDTESTHLGAQSTTSIFIGAMAETTLTVASKITTTLSGVTEVVEVQGTGVNTAVKSGMVDMVMSGTNMTLIATIQIYM